MSCAILGELLLVLRMISELRPNFLKHFQNSHFNYNDPALIHSTTVYAPSKFARNYIISFEGYDGFMSKDFEAMNAGKSFGQNPAQISIPVP